VGLKIVSIISQNQIVPINMTRPIRIELAEVSIVAIIILVCIVVLSVQCPVPWALHPLPLSL